MTTETRSNRIWTVPDISGFYHDDGCALHSACLTCPFDDCVADKVLMIQTNQRHEAIRADLAAGLTVAQAAAKYNVDRRTIERAKRGGR